MSNIRSNVSVINWQKVTQEMNDRGYATVSSFFSNTQCEELVENYNKEKLYRKTVVMERYRFGLGEYKYFKYPLPPLIQTTRENLYSHLAPIANSWMKMLNIDKHFPDTFGELEILCHTHNQTKATVLILKYGKGGHNTLHQDLYGEIFFPIQVVLFLNEPDTDYTGGEFVLTQQTLRAQSKAIVLKPKKGDMLIFTTSFRPVKGARGYYRATMKHGVSELHEGERHTLGIIFHDALN
jgi:uncharacterized protein